MFSGSVDVARGQKLGSVHAVVDVHEAPRLLAVAPDLDGVRAAQLGLGDLAADRGGRLLAAAVVGAVGPVDVVIAGHASRQLEVLAEVAAHALAEELLPAVPVLGHRRICVRLGERRDVRGGLVLGGVDAGRRREEEALDLLVARGHQHVRVDEDGEHAEGLVGLDEPHPAHVGRQVVHPAGAGHRLPAGVEARQVEDHVLGVRRHLVPLVERLLVDRAHAHARAARGRSPDALR